MEMTFQAIMRHVEVETMIDLNNVIDVYRIFYLTAVHMINMIRRPDVEIKVLTAVWKVRIQLIKAFMLRTFFS